MSFPTSPYGCWRCAAPATDGGAATRGAPLSGIDRAHGDATVRAQDDFFRHVNGLWLATTPMPPDKARIGSFESLAEDTQTQLRALIEDRASHAGDADARKIADLYASFMDEAALESLGTKPLAAELAAIDALTASHQLGAAMARLARLGVPLPLALYVRPDAKDATRNVAYLTQDGLGLPDRDYYLDAHDAKFRAVRTHYAEHLATLLALAGDAAAGAQAVLALETELARGQWTRVDNRDPLKTYHPCTPAELARLAPAFDWDGYLGAAGLGGRSDTLILRQPSHAAAFGALLERVPLATWQAYLRTRLLGAYAPFLGRAFVDARFAFAGTVLRGTPENLPRWKRGVALVDEALGDALGRLYVARHFPPAHKAEVEALVAQLMSAYRLRIDRLDWMGAATRQQAQAKLAAFALKIGYPSTWKDHAALEIRPDDLVGNVMRARECAHRRELAKLGSAVDRDEWFITPQTVNAYYNPALNEIVFPAAILQPPFFDATVDAAVNYGAIGAVIGHEISHGFDDQGSRYDGLGNLRDWWSADDRARFEAGTRRLVAQYGAYEPLPGYRLDGALSLGENIADNAGLAIAYQAYRLSLGGREPALIDGLSGDQRFFFGWAQVWRAKARDEAMIQQLKAGPHAPAEFRVNGTLRNHPGFYASFGVQPGDALYLPPAQRVAIW